MDLLTQTFSSASTSINSHRLPAVYTRLTKDAEAGRINLEGLSVLDMGCGQYTDHLQAWAEAHGVTWYGLDPNHGTAGVSEYDPETSGPVDLVICSNVLNVIDQPVGRLCLIKACFEMLKPGGRLLVTVYEGDRSGIGRQTGPDQWQANARLTSYLPQIQYFSPEARVRGQWIEATC